MQTKILFLFFVIAIAVDCTKKDAQNGKVTASTINNKGAQQISAKKMPNHISRKNLSTTKNLVRNVKRHKMVQKELVEENNFEIIAQKKSKFLNKALGFSKGFKIFTRFSQLVAQIRQQDSNYDLNQTLEETLTKYIHIANRIGISRRGDNFYYLYEYNSFKTFIVDLREKKANIENLCNFGRKKNLVQCQYKLHEAYHQLYLYFNDLDLATVTSPEFKDKFEEQIDEKQAKNLNKNDIDKITKQYQKNIVTQSEKIIEKFRKMINDMFHRKNNVISNVHESIMVKQKVYDEIVQFLNNKIYIRKSKDHIFNFYAYHFTTSLDHLLGPVFVAEKNGNISTIISPYRCYVYERSRVEDLQKDIQSLKDYLSSIKDKSFKNFKKNLKTLQNFLKDLDKNYSENFYLEQLKDARKSPQGLRAKSGKRTTQNLNIKSGVRPTVNRKKNDNQKIAPALKKKILERIIGFHTKVPKSRLSKRVVFFRKNYEQSKINKERSCEKSFYALLDAGADMFIGSEDLDYRGEEIRIFAYIYRNDFYKKLYQKMRLMQECLKKQPLTKSNEEVRQAYQKVIERFNQIHRLNNDYIELEIQYNIAAIRRKLNHGQEPTSDFIGDEEKNRIELYKDQLRKNFYAQRGIKEEPSNQIDPEMLQTERTYEPVTQRSKEFPHAFQLDKSSSEEQPDKKMEQQIKHKNRDLSFESDSDSLEMSEEQMNIEMQNLNKEIQKYDKINKNKDIVSDSSQTSNEQMFEMMEDENSYEDTSDENDYEKPQMDLQNLHKSKMLQILIKLNEIDQSQQEWNLYKTYKRAIYHLITYINNINITVEDNSFNEGKRGTWVVLKFQEDQFEMYVNQLKVYMVVLSKFYTMEADDLRQKLTLLITYINQELHKTKGFYYERYFVPGQEDSNSQEESIDLSKVPNYNNRLQIQKIKISKLHPIGIQLIFDINKKFLDFAQQQEDPQNFQEDVDKLIDSFNGLLDDDNLILKSKFNQRKNRYVNYGIFKYKSEKYDQLEKDTKKLINDLEDNEDDTSNDLLNDLNDLLKFFNKLKGTRAYLYETTNAEFDNNMNFIKYDSDDQSVSLDEESSESVNRNKNEKDPRRNIGSLSETSSEEDISRDQSNSQDQIDSSNLVEDKLRRKKHQQKINGKNSIEYESESSNEFDYEVNSTSVISEQEKEESMSSQEDLPEPSQMNLDKITYSKLYKPLQNIQNTIINDKDYLQKFNDMAHNFNMMTDNENLVQIVYKKVYKYKVKIGTYHYEAQTAKTFLLLITEMSIYLEELEGHDLLIDDLKLIAKIFDTFISTRFNYHEAFSAVLVNDKQDEISKPLFDFDFDNLRFDEFSMLTDDERDIQNKNKKLKQKSQGDSSNQNSSDAEDPLKNRPSQDKQNRYSLEDSPNKQITIKSHPVNLSLEDSSEEVQDNNDLNKDKSVVQKQTPKNNVSSHSQEGQNLDIQNQESSQEEKVVKRKRKIYVIEILECDDCMEYGYMTIDLE